MCSRASPLVDHDRVYQQRRAKSVVRRRSSPDQVDVLAVEEGGQADLLLLRPPRQRLPADLGARSKSGGGKAGKGSRNPKNKNSRGTGGGDCCDSSINSSSNNRDGSGGAQREQLTLTGGGSTSRAHTSNRRAIHAGQSFRRIYRHDGGGSPISPTNEELLLLTTSTLDNRDMTTKRVPRQWQQQQDASCQYQLRSVHHHPHHPQQCVVGEEECSPCTQEHTPNNMEGEGDLLMPRTTELQHPFLQLDFSPRQPPLCHPHHNFQHEQQQQMLLRHHSPDGQESSPAPAPGAPLIRFRSKASGNSLVQNAQQQDAATLGNPLICHHHHHHHHLHLPQQQPVPHPHAPLDPGDQFRQQQIAHWQEQQQQRADGAMDGPRAQLLQRLKAVAEEQQHRGDRHPEDLQPVEGEEDSSSPSVTLLTARNLQLHIAWGGFRESLLTQIERWMQGLERAGCMPPVPTLPSPHHTLRA